MLWLFLTLLNLISSSTDTELARQLEYLRAENEMLMRRLPKRIYLNQDEKRLLVKSGLAVGSGITAFLTIVSYPTFRRWVSLMNPVEPRIYAKSGRKPGRPPNTR